MKRINHTTTRSSLTLLIILLAIGLAGMLMQSCSLQADQTTTRQRQALENFEQTVRSAKPELKTFAEAQRGFAKGEGAGYEDEAAEEQAARKLMQPLLESSEELLTSYGFTPGDFGDSELSMDDPATIYLSFAILKMEEMEVKQASIMNMLKTVLSGNEYAASEFWDCALEAVGMEIAIEIFRVKSLESISGRKRLIKLFTKIGARYLGYIGVAITTYHFIDCMWVD